MSAPRPSASTVDLSTPRRVHVVGVGGPGMSAVARLLVGAGHIVSGSDMVDSPALGALRSVGVDARHGHDPEWVRGADIVTYSTAVPIDNVELVAARSAGIATVHRSVVLAGLTARHRSVGVAGTHGKTTTSALLTVMLRAAGRDPSFYIGADVADLDGGAGTGGDGTLVIEADESDGTAEALLLDSLLLTNIDSDHLDRFGNIEGVEAGFARIIGGVAGLLVVCGDDQRALDVVRRSRRPHLTYGFGASCDVVVGEPLHTAAGLVFSVTLESGPVEVVLPLRGLHNALNCAGALVMAVGLGADPVRAARGVANFGGVDRRFREHGTHRGALLIDDYAHLPAEIAAALAAARTHPALTGRVVAVFQPNRFHRVAAMAGDYAGCFDGADMVFITDIYASGTERIEGVTGMLVVDAVRTSHADVTWAATRGELVRAVDAVLGEGDVCVSMGCGDIATFPDDMRAAHE